MIEPNNDQLILLTTHGFSPSNSKDGIWYKDISDEEQQYIDFRGDNIKAYGYRNDKPVIGDLKTLRRLRIVNDKTQMKLFDEKIWRKEEYE